MAHKPRGYWTKERCREEAKKYHSKGEFRKGSVGAHDTAYKNKWIDDICGHMKELKKPNDYWTKEACHAEALKYTTKVAFMKGSGGAYHAARRKGWLNDICDHMVVLWEQKWTKEACHVEALKYHTKIAFMKGSAGAYSAAHKNKWIGDICGHMKTLGPDLNGPCVVYEFASDLEDKKQVVYIGITEAIFTDGEFDEEKTIKSRYGNRCPEIQGMVFVNHGIYPRLYGDFEGMPGHVVTREEALEIEKDSIDVAVSDGHVVLNTVHNSERNDKDMLVEIFNECRLYGFGDWEERLYGYEPVFRWTKERCREEALKYTTKISFRSKANGAYQAANKNKWMDGICGHMVGSRKPNGYWTKKRCHEEAKKYPNKTIFARSSGGAWDSAWKNGWINDICGHMVELQKPHGYWQDKERCREEAKKYSTRSAFRKGSPGAYQAARNNGWLVNCCEHMEESTKPRGHWHNKKKCHEEAKKYPTKSDFRKYSGSAYNVAWRNKWLDEFFPKRKKNV